MILYIGADHGGFALKEALKQFLSESGYTVNDVGNKELDSNDDYVDFAKMVADEVSRDVYSRKGILICRSGHGVDIVANRYPQIRSALAFTPDHAAASRNDDDSNVLSLPADYIDLETAKKIVSVWLQTPFSEDERHKRRIEKINHLGNSIH